MDAEQKPKKHYSYILTFPNEAPFDNLDYRWPSFLAEFVAPLVRGRLTNFHYWCSYYVNEARFRIYTDEEQFAELLPSLNAAMKDLKLKNCAKEKNETISDQLANNRFIGPDTKSNKLQRAELLIQSLQSVCALLIDSLVPVSGRYWRFEANGNQEQNPIGNHFFSITHLYHNMTLSDGLIVEFDQPPKKGLLSYYYFWAEVAQGHLQSAPKQDIVVRL